MAGGRRGGPFGAENDEAAVVKGGASSKSNICVGFRQREKKRGKKKKKGRERRGKGNGEEVKKNLSTK